MAILEFSTVSCLEHGLCSGDSDAGTVQLIYCNMTDNIRYEDVCHDSQSVTSECASSATSLIETIYRIHHSKMEPKRFSFLWEIT